VRISLNQYIDQISRYFLADVNLTLDRPQRVDEIRDLLTRLPQVAEVEGWAQARTEVVHPDGSVGESVSLLAPPTGSRLVEPILLSGRWLAPGDENAIVLSERFRSLFPNLREGSDIRLKVNGKEQDWRVVGFFQLAGKSGGYLAYAPYEYVSSLIHQPFKASTFRVVARNKSMSVEEQKQFGREIETYLETSGYHVSDVTAGLFLREVSSNGLSILTAFLLFMASLIALVGSIGLTGTMSINVMERTREIGVMRAIGASNRTLMNMVIIEGMIIGLTSWVLGSLLAFPISKIMSDRVSISLFDAPSNFRYTATGFIVWLVAVIILSVLASVMPARNAARLTIREVLAYE
jgi:putative ABC transport system permease protein